MASIYDIICGQTATSAAIGAPGRGHLTYGALRALMEQTASALNGMGLGRKDRIAIVLPNGPEMGTAFLSVAACASAAPLNPAYTQDEFAYYLQDLGAKLLLVEAGSTSAAVAAATALKIPVVQIDWADTDAAGWFLLAGFGPQRTPELAGWSQGADEALVLHTSGTTSRPKVVPLSAANLLASAGNVSTSLALSPGDTGLSIMPLFHIHGLIASLLATMSAGACVVCTPGFNALKFFQWLQAVDPSWYTAVPTMHQAILARASRNKDAVKFARLRFIRSSSSSLPPPVMAELEEVFDCLVIEAYGMTEACHLMASNPLPPAARKAGTVGKAAGPEVAIMNEAGEVLPRGENGEIVIRGDNVFSAYENNPEANATAFSNGWFRTGDLGVLDSEGYLTISGRLKEIINRGGEKIAPREVDDVLQAHAAIAQIVTFALPHDKLGETVAAVVVFKEGQSAEVSELRAFAAQSLAAFKVPSKIFIRDEIPKGATGKLQRIGLAQKLGLCE
jgi:oxalate---CoA ligase